MDRGLLPVLGPTNIIPNILPFDQPRNRCFVSKRGRVALHAWRSLNERTERFPRSCLKQAGREIDAFLFDSHKSHSSGLEYAPFLIVSAYCA